MANRALHHVHDLASALKKIRSLLRDGGALILNEFAWDQMDQHTARWYLAHVDEPGSADISLLPENFPTMWVEEHDGLHTSSFMRAQLDSYFQTQLFEERPYIAGHYLNRDDLEAEEARLIKTGEINAIGFRYVGRKPPG